MSNRQKSGVLNWYKDNPEQIELRRKLSYDTIAGYNKGRSFSDEHKEKISKSNSGKKRPKGEYPNSGMRNKKHTKETKSKISVNTRKGMTDEVKKWIISGLIVKNKKYINTERYSDLRKTLESSEDIEALLGRAFNS